MAIFGNMIGGAAPLKTLILTDESGNTFTGVVTGSEVIFDATPEDVIVGKKFASDGGILEGTNTKTYRVRFGNRLILPSTSFSIPIEEYDGYDYTKFEAMISIFSTTDSDSTTIDKISLFNSVYNTGSNIKISDVTKNIESKSIDLNILNDTDNTYIVHYSTYKEETV